MSLFLASKSYLKKFKNQIMVPVMFLIFKLTNQIFGMYVVFAEQLYVEQMHENFKGALSGLRQFLAFESTLKMMKNAFYFLLKARFVLKIFKFLFLLLNVLIRKIKLVLKFMMSRPG